MLSLSRKSGESIIINDDIVCTVLEISGKHVKLGFKYPASATVYREEIYNRIQQENQSAVQNVEMVEQAITSFKKVVKQHS